MKTLFSNGFGINQDCTQSTDHFLFQQAVAPSGEQSSTEEDIVLFVDGQKELENLKKQGDTEVDLLNVFKNINNWIIMSSKVGLKDKLLFYEVFYSMIYSGVEITDALDIIIGQTRNPKLKIIIQQIQESINQGKSFSESLSEFADTFEESDCSIIRAGESSGDLPGVLKQLIAQKSRSEKIQKKVKSAMIYPAVVISIMIIVGVLMIKFLIPKLLGTGGSGGIFGSLEELPWATQVLVDANTFMTEHWTLFIFSIFALVATVSFGLRTTIGKKIMENLAFAIPGIGAFKKQVVLSRFTRIFSFMLNSGVEIVPALEIAARGTGSMLYSDRIQLAANDISQGIEISENFSDNEQYFPRDLVKMIAVGERSSNLGGVLSKFSDYYEESLEQKTEVFSKILEPIIIFVLAGGVIFLIMAIYLPILQMNDSIGGL